MKICSDCKISEERVSFYKNAASHDGLCNICKECSKLRKKRPTYKISTTNSRIKRREKINAYQRKYAKENREKFNSYQRKYADKNRDKIRELNRKSYNSEKQRPKNNARAALRRALKLKATLPGFKDEIEKIYKNCPVGYHVDHIVPLKGKNVRGLHVPWNLQYLPALDNLKKGNKTIL